ncbi:MAG: methylenetetrahydrofolate reductase [NAD(P)H] [Elusimicrobiota bacterium]|nr:methylenetetrahydrofolate reductase [NAD(P)H] [Elusimicrobiota bacterium]
MTAPLIEIPELFGRGRPVFSFEFFLPKAPDDLDGFLAEVRALRELGPDYVTLTYGAGGSARDRTIDTAGRLQKETGLPTACHLTGIAHDKAEVAAILGRLEAMGIRHLVALRGDAPKDAPVKPVGERDFGYAADLVRFVKARGGFRMAVAAYPEKHPEAASAEADLAAFAAKVREGADWAMTQLFFDAKDYFAFVARARAAGVSVPIVPGIMPVTGYAQLKRFTALCGTRIPAELDAELARRQADADAVVRFGIDWATAQCRDLLAGGAPGIHFYTLNKSRSTAEVLKRLRA